MLRTEIESLVLDLAHRHYQGGRLAEELEARLAAAGPRPPPRGQERPPTPPPFAELARWARETLGAELTAEELQTLGPAQVRGRLVAALDARYRPEMREMEKAVLLQILDSSWMEHLRAMDHLRSSIGLQGYAQIDPKVEYKREGMRIFAEMWAGIADRVTDLIFRVEQFDPEFLDYLGSRYNKLDRAKTIHQRRSLNWRRPRRRAGCATSRTRPSPAASNPPRRSASQSATLARKSAAMTRAPADPVKNSKPAACGSKPAGDPF